MAKKGGKREGAGRPKGSTNTYKLSDYVSEKDRKVFVEFILSNYMGDMRLATWLGEHLFAKPKQDVDVTSGGEKWPTPILNVVSGDNGNPKGSRTK